MQGNSVILSIVLCILTEGVFSIIANGLLLLVFYKNPLKNMWQCSSILIFNLTMSDFLAGFIFVYWSTAYWHRHWNQEWLGEATLQIMWFFTLTSTFTLSILSFERYLVVRIPWNAPQIITKRRTMALCAISWIVSLVLCSAFASDKPAFMLVSGGLIELSVTIQMLFYVLLWRKMKTNESSFPPNHESEQRQLAIVVFLLILMLIITALPISISYQMLYHSRLTDTSFASPDLSWITFCLMPLYCLNFFINPLLYAWRLQKYRSSLIAIFRITESTTQFTI